MKNKENASQTEFKYSIWNTRIGDESALQEKASANIPSGEPEASENREEPRT